MRPLSIGEEHPRDPGLYRYEWLRWLAVPTALVITVPSYLVLGIQLPWLLLLSILAVVVGSNFFLLKCNQIVERYPQRTVTLFLLLDLILFTTLLYFTGGAHNPFTTLYLLFITVAILLLPSATGWLMVFACTLSFIALFSSGHVLSSHTGAMTCCSDMSGHLQGMVIALCVTGCGIVFFVSSVSRDHRRRKDALQQLDQEIQESREISGLATLAASVAHELATPLGTIAIVSRDLEQFDRDSGASFREDARLIREEVERCRQVLMKLGEETSLASEEQPVPIDESLFRDEFPLFLNQSLYQRLSIKIDRGFGSIPLPPHGFFFALAVLVKNAFDASAPDQSVTVEWLRTRENIQFLVRDTGSGMSREFTEQLGKPFFTGKKKGTGMGLGLFLVRTFCEHHSGHLSFQSEVGRGTTATMKFPISRS